MNRAKGTTCKATLAIAIAIVSATAGAEVIYENDFATRTSASPVPSREWRSYDYVTGLIANTNGAAPFAETAYPTGSVQEMQDGWIKAAKSKTNTGLLANARVWAGIATNENPAVVLGDEDANHPSACLFKQRLGNSFTSGVVTAQFDFMPPPLWSSNWGDGNFPLRRAALSVGDEAFYSPKDISQQIDQSQQTDYSHTVGSVGVAIYDSGDGNGRKRKVYFNADADTANTNTTEVVVDTGAWYRALLSIDLDNRTWGFSMFKMGEHPALDAATPASPIYSASGLAFADQTVTGVSSIALGGFGMSWSGTPYSASTTPTHVAWFDNIRVSHDGEECYVNDFATCSRRRLDGTTAHAYVADCLVTNRVESEVYVVNQDVVPDLADTSKRQPDGMDGWRRAFHGAGNAKSYISSSSDYTVMRCEGTPSTPGVAYLAHPFGTTVSSGKVRAKVDVRLHSTWAYNANYLQTVWLTLGNENYYNAPPSGASSDRFVSAGIRATSSSKSQPLYLGSAGTQLGDASANIVKSHWYRLVVTADIDNGTAVYQIYDQGDSSSPNSATPDGTLIYTSPAIAKCNAGVTSLSCFAVAAYFCTAYFDNIKVSSIDPVSGAETPLYENYFTSRTVYSQDKRIAPLIGTEKFNPVGQDGWTHLYINEPTIFVDWADGNPVLAFPRYQFELYAAHDLGQNVRSGMLVSQVDMKPPKGWLASGGSAYVRFGGDAHIQNSLRSDDTYFFNNTATGFGFKNVGSGKSGNIYTNSTIVAYRGDLAGGGAMENAQCAVDATHWYRFVATADVSRSLYDVDVYDMGTAHPTLATATPGTPVATFSALPFRRTRNDLGGISCFSAGSVNTAQSVFDSSLQPMIDNIRVSVSKNAFVLTIR